MSRCLVWAVELNKKRTNKLTNRISKVGKLVAFIARVPSRTNNGKVQIATALIQACADVLDTTDFSVYEKVKFMSTFAEAYKMMLITGKSPDRLSPGIN